MVTFAEFLENAASKREFVNVLFEERVFELIGTLQELSLPLEQAGVPHELVGGLAVFLHVENADSTHSSLTRDIDVMIRRDDLPRVVAIAKTMASASGIRQALRQAWICCSSVRPTAPATLSICSMRARKLKRLNSSPIPASTLFAPGCMARISG